MRATICVVALSGSARRALSVDAAAGTLVSWRIPGSDKEITTWDSQDIKGNATYLEDVPTVAWTDMCRDVPSNLLNVKIRYPVVVTSSLSSSTPLKPPTTCPLNPEELKRNAANPQLTDICDETLRGPRGSWYMGCQSYTRTGNRCVLWATTGLALHNYPMNHNFCRNLDSSETIWCFVNRGSLVREHCDPVYVSEVRPSDDPGRRFRLPGGPMMMGCSEWLNLGMPDTYSGCQTHTVDGKACGPWQLYKQLDGVIRTHSYCRQITSLRNKLVCYEAQSSHLSVCQQLPLRYNFNETLWNVAFRKEFDLLGDDGNALSNELVDIYGKQQIKIHKNDRPSKIRFDLLEESVVYFVEFSSDTAFNLPFEMYIGDSAHGDFDVPCVKHNLKNVEKTLNRLDCVGSGRYFFIRFPKIVTSTFTLIDFKLYGRPVAPRSIIMRRPVRTAHIITKDSRALGGLAMNDGDWSTRLDICDSSFSVPAGKNTVWRTEFAGVHQVGSIRLLTDRSGVRELAILVELTSIGTDPDVIPEDPTNSPNLCTIVAGPLRPNMWYEFQCKKPITGHFLTIFALNKGKLQLCEIQAFGVNMAKAASTTITASGNSNAESMLKTPLISTVAENCVTVALGGPAGAELSFDFKVNRSIRMVSFRRPKLKNNSILRDFLIDVTRDGERTVCAGHSQTASGVPQGALWNSECYTNARWGSKLTISAYEEFVICDVAIYSGRELPEVVEIEVVDSAAPIKLCYGKDHICDKNATCEDTNGGMYCQCLPPFTGDGLIDGAGCSMAEVELLRPREVSSSTYMAAAGGLIVATLIAFLALRMVPSRMEGVLEPEGFEQE